MKIYAIILFFAFAAGFSSCKKCETCVPYRYYSATNTVDTVPDIHNAQTVKLCDKTDIDAYESLTTFNDASNKPVRFICK